MNLTPRMIKVWSILCTVLLSVGMMMAPTAPVWAFSDISMGTTAQMLAMTDTVPADEALTDSEIDKLVGDIAPDKPGIDDSENQPSAASGGIYIRLNGACDGISPAGNIYHGVWKKLGNNKAKCKEGAGGAPGQLILRSKCRIVTLNDGNFDNLDVVSPYTCKDN